MRRRLVARREQSGGFDHHLHPQLAPRQLGRIAFREHLERLAVDHDVAALDLDLMPEPAVDRVVLEQMGERGSVGDIVDRDDFEVLFAQRRAKEHPADPAEAVDPDPDRHSRFLPLRVYEKVQSEMQRPEP